MKSGFILFIALLAVLTIGCPSGQQPTGNSQSTEGNALANTNWRMESFGAVDNQQPIQREKTSFDASIEFGDKKFGGRIAGCNIISYNYQASGSKISAQSETTTAMACSEEVMKQERELTEAFKNAKEFRIDGDQLEITYESGKVIRAKRLKKEN